MRHGIFIDVENELFQHQHAEGIAVPAFGAAGLAEGFKYAPGAEWLGNIKRRTEKCSGFDQFQQSGTRKINKVLQQGCVPIGLYFVGNIRPIENRAPGRSG